MTDAIRVLHVDDEPRLADLTAEFLEREDEQFTVTTATCARDGLRRLADADCDCVISDYDMPEKNGIEFLEAVRDEYPALPFILFTGKGSEEVASDAISAGVTDYLQKQRGTEQYTVLANRVRNAVEATRAQQQRDRQLEAIETAREGISILDDDGRFIYVNRAYADLFGYEPEGMVGNHWELIYPDDEVQTLRDEVLPEVEARGYWHGTTTGCRADGDTFLGDHRLALTEQDELVCTIRDLSDQTERDRALKRTNAVLSTLVETLPAGVLVEDESRNVLAINDRMFELFGMPGTPEDVIGADCEHMAREVSDLFVEPDAFVDRINELVTERKRVHGENLRLRDGRTFARSHEPIELPDGNGHLWMYRDVTDQQTRERELQQRTEELEELTSQLEEQYRYLFEEAPVMAVVTGTDRGEPIIDDCNQLFAETVGYEKDEIIGQELAAFYTPDSQRELLEEGGYARALSGEFMREDRSLVTRDGEPVETLLRAVPRYDLDDDIVGTIALFVDISERKELEREKNRLDEFTGIVSHDLRNPLTVAQGSLELAREECESAYLEDVAHAHGRMEALIEDLLALAHSGQQIDELEPIPLEYVARTCWQTVETADATLEMQTTRSIRADRGRLQQLFENLFRNATEHGGKDVTVTVGELDDGFFVADDGRGIPAEDRVEVFDTGYSQGEEGTGFGLSIVQQIADAHDWTVRVTDGPDGGARFDITGVELVTDF